MKRENRESRYHHALSEYNAKLTQIVTLRDALRDSERRMHVPPQARFLRVTSAFHVRITVSAARVPHTCYCVTFVLFKEVMGLP